MHTVTAERPDDHQCNNDTGVHVVVDLCHDVNHCRSSIFVNDHAVKLSRLNDDSSPVDIRVERNGS